MNQAQSRRELVLHDLHVDDAAISMESIQDPWGDDDNIIASFLTGTYDECATIKFWVLLALKAAKGAIVVDVGAYTGFFSLIAAKATGIEKIVAFEPSTVTFGRLARNILINCVDQRIVPCNLAAAEVEKVISMPHRWGHYTLCSGESLMSDDSDHSQPAFCVPLDCLLSPSDPPHYLNSRSNSPWPHSRVAAIKIDVEGAELDVLAGARGLIARDRPAIIAEALNGEAEVALGEFASSVGYGCVRIGNERNLALIATGDEEVAALLARAQEAPAVIKGFRRMRYAV